MSERDTAIMGALELALDVAYHDGTSRELAVAAEGWTLAGYHDGSITIAHSGQPGDLLRCIERARKGLPRRLLRADARGMLTAFKLLADEGVISWSSTAEARRQRWLTRGGHDGPFISSAPLAAAGSSAGTAEEKT